MKIDIDGERGRVWGGGADGGGSSGGGSVTGDVTGTMVTWQRRNVGKANVWT